MKIILKILSIGCLSFVAFIAFFAIVLWFHDNPRDVSQRKQPYKINDELIFKSSFGQIDKITIVGFENRAEGGSLFNYQDPIKILAVRAQREIVKMSKNDAYYCINDSGERFYINDIYYNYYFLSEYDLLKLDSKNYLQFGHMNAWFSYEKYKNYKGNSAPYNSLKLNYRRSEWDDDLTLWYSKKYGILKYTEMIRPATTPNAYWELIEFRRNGKNILPKIE